MQMVTTFFNNEQYHMENYLTWYRKLWNTDSFIFFIGKRKLDNTNYIKNGLKFLVTKNNDVTTYEYESKTNTADQWNQLKQIFYEVIRCNHRVYPSIWMDSDDLIYAKDIGKLIKDGQFKTHFYEHVPIKPFSFNDNTLWCVQPWYYREQALGNKHITHQNCASYSLSPDRQGCHQGDPNGHCNTAFNYDDYSTVVYHIGVHSREHYLNSKHWLQTHPQGIGISDQIRQSGELVDVFDKYYVNCEFPTFNLNLYERYLK